jgi:hypothetical protein
MFVNAPDDAPDRVRIKFDLFQNEVRIDKENDTHGVRGPIGAPAGPALPGDRTIYLQSRRLDRRKSSLLTNLSLCIGINDSGRPCKHKLLTWNFAPLGLLRMTTRTGSHKPFATKLTS